MALMWVSNYMKCKPAALIEFMQFVLDACGSRYRIPKDSTMPFEHMSIIISGATKYQNVSVFYPMILKTGDEFVNKVSGFVQTLLEVADTTDIRSDPIFVSEIFGFVMTCSNSRVRAFRHTGTMIGLRMMTTLQDLWSTNQAENVWQNMFERLFEQRYNDVVDDIRLICLAELGVWLAKYPDCYVQPKQMIFLFKGLQDTSPTVLRCCLKALAVFSSKEVLREAFLALVKHFKDVLFALCGQNECKLSELALNVLSDSMGFLPDLLNAEECFALDALMFAANRGLAQSAGEFFCQRLKETLKPKRLREIAQFFINFNKHEHAAYLVDALYGNCQLILDWQVMVEMLLEKQTPDLSEREISTIIEILSRGVQQAITGEVPPGRYTSHILPETMPGAKELASEILVPVMATLLQKYNKDAIDLMNLLELMQLLTLSQMDHCEQIIEEIKNIMFANFEEPVLRLGAYILANLSWVDTRITLEVLNSAVTNYKISLRDFQLENSCQLWKPWSDRQLSCLRLVCALNRHFDLSEYHLRASVLDRLIRYWSSKEALSEETRCLFLEVLYIHLNWDLKNIREPPYAEPVLEVRCSVLKSNLVEFLLVAKNILSFGCAYRSACDAFLYICDLAVLFGDQLRETESAEIRKLFLKISLDEVELLEGFVKGILNVDPLEMAKPAQFDDLQMKRKVLSGYCKLVAFNVVPSMRSFFVFQYYERYHTIYGDIMRSALERALNVNSVNYGMTILHSLLVAFNNMMDTYNKNAQEAVKSEEFRQLINLAKLFAETFNPNLMDYRKGVLTLHRAGILLVADAKSTQPTAPPENLLFLRLLCEFVPQLLDQDKPEMMSFLNMVEPPDLPSCHREEWLPFEAYRTVLQAK
ncbi:hypothetical protein KR018_001542, partial [Drosophila ironensis]